MMDFSNVTSITIPEGSVERIRDSNKRVLWEKKHEVIPTTYPPDINSGQSFTLSTQMRNYCKIQGTNIAENQYITQVSWSSTTLPTGISLDNYGELSGIPTVTGEYEPSITVKTEHGKDTEKVKLIIPRVTPSIVSGQEVIGFYHESMPEYAIRYNGDVSTSSGDYWSISWGTGLTTAMKYNSTIGAISSNYLELSDGRISYGLPQKCTTYVYIYDKNGTKLCSGGMSVWVVERKSTYNNLTTNYQFRIMGIPSALVKVGGTANVRYVLFENPEVYGNNCDGKASEVSSSNITLTGSSNLSISGTNVTVNSAGSCSLTAKTTIQYINNSGNTATTTKTTTTTWTAR